MNQAKPVIPKRNFSSLKGLSIQQRLPLLICILLLSIVIAVGIASYIGVKRTSLRIASDRLKVVTEQLSSILGQTAHAAMLSARAIANDEAVKQYLQFPGTVPDSLVKTSLRKLQTDTQSLYVELVNKSGQQVLRAGKQSVQLNIDINRMLSELQIAPDSGKVGKMYLSGGDSLYYPIVAAITDNKQTIGYLIRWRLVFATEQAMQQFSQLLGTNASIYIGNEDGSAWCDMIKPVDPPPINVQDTSSYFSYSRSAHGLVLATSRPISHTQWTLLIEFSQKTILAGAKQFATWILVIGGMITIIGIIIAWVMSRNITRPLNKLTLATTAIAAGRYTSSVEVNRRDELGELARTFNIMTAEIKNAQETLEQKVKERTIQLEEANKELEAFSYSVSHDLRAPLRAISGYAMMLKEDYSEKLDNEAVRITNIIITNAKMMGQLIDDLIAFSKMGSKGITYQTVDMKRLAASCTDELLKHEPPGKYNVEIDDLPGCGGDPNLLKQVWMNLIGNAIKYSSQAVYPCIKIGGNEDNAAYHYFVKDNGVGFDMQYANKLFGVFQRLHTDAVYKGTGIGLALVKRIVDKHHGTIRAESEPGNGATFYFDIPKTNLL